MSQKLYIGSVVWLCMHSLGLFKIEQVHSLNTTVIKSFGFQYFYRFSLATEISCKHYPEMVLLGLSWAMEKLCSAVYAMVMEIVTEILAEYLHIAKCVRKYMAFE